MRKRLASLPLLDHPLVSGFATRHTHRAALPTSTNRSLATRRGAQPYAQVILVLLLGSLAGCGPAASQSTPTIMSVPVTPTLPTAPGATVSATIMSVMGSIDPGYLYGIAADDSAVWVLNSERGVVVRIDPATNKAVATIPLASTGLGDVVLGDGAVWVATRNNDTVTRIDPATNRITATIKLQLAAGMLAVTPGAVWAASKESDIVWKIDPQTNQAGAPLPIDDGPLWMAVSAGSLWICNKDGEKFGVTRLDPTTNQVLAQIDIGSANNRFCGGLAASDGVVWVEQADSQDHAVGLARIDPATNRVNSTIPLPTSIGVDALAADAQGVWVADPGLGLLRISSQTNKAVSLLPLIRGAGLALGSGSVWLATNDGSLLRIAPTS